MTNNEFKNKLQTIQNHTNINVDNITSEEESKIIDTMINLETKRRVLLLPQAKAFGILTACYINGEFKLISEYDIDDVLEEKLKTV